MSPALTFFGGLGLLVLFGWYFATDVGLRKRILATTLVMLLVAFSIATIWPPKEKIQLGLDIQGGTSFLIRLMGGDKEVNKGMLDQAVEVISLAREFGVSEMTIRRDLRRLDRDGFVRHPVGAVGTVMVRHPLAIIAVTT